MRHLSEKVRMVVEAYEALGFKNEELINELWRFKAVDQIVSSSAKAKTWGLSLTELYEIAKSSTEEFFGKFTITENDLNKLYMLSFTVEPLDVAHELGLYKELGTGKEWKSVFEPALVDFANESSQTILFIGVEKYISLLDPILQGFPKDKVILQTSSDEGYQVLKALYPLANLVSDVNNLAYSHVLGIHTQENDELLEIISQQLKKGELVKANLFLAPYFGYKKNTPMFELLNSKGLVAIEEYLGLGVYQWIFTSENSDEIEINLRYDTEKWNLEKVKKTNSLLKSGIVIGQFWLRQENTIQYDGEDRFILGEVAKLAKLEEIETLRAHDIIIQKKDDNYIIRPLGVGVDVFNFSRDSSVLIFDDEVDGYTWAAFLGSSHIQSSLVKFKQLAKNSFTYGQLLCSIASKDLEADKRKELADWYEKSFKQYIQSLQKIEKRWKMNQETFENYFE